MSLFNNLSAQQLRQAANLKEQIETLEKQLGQLLGSPAKPVAAAVTIAKIVAAKVPKKKGGMSAAGKAKVAAAQKARWAKLKAAKPAAQSAPETKPAVVSRPGKKKFTMSAAAKAKISAAAKARWAKIKAAKK